MFWPRLTAPLCVLLTYLAVAASEKLNCRCRPDDPCWPSALEWEAFNATVDGRLIRTVPEGHVCHDPTYDEKTCLALRQRWTAPETHYESSHSIMAPVFANGSCSPWTERESPCGIGAYIQYAVNVSTTEHVRETVALVRRHNIRLVIRNTGHDYLGKSSGPFSLALWTHHLSSLSVLSWSDKTYNGPAIRLSAGVQAFDLLAFAARYNLTALTGTCPSVGIAGGYIQGGGHSALSSKYGLAADQLLEMDVVDAQGRVMTVSRDEHADLFWALSGGGGGTFAVVLNVTVRAYWDLPSATGLLEFQADNNSERQYLAGIAFFQAMLPEIHAAGCATMYRFTRNRFTLSLFCHGTPSARVLELLHPLIAELHTLGLPHRHTATNYARWSDGARVGWLEGGTEQYQVNNVQAATWLVPQAAVRDRVRNTAIISALLGLQDLGAIVGVQTFHPSRHVAAATDNAVFPGWRDAGMLVWVILPANDSLSMAELVDDQKRLSTVLMPVIQLVAPEGGTYLNEADPVDAEWKRNYYGTNYERLLEIKHKYDPEDLFYARHAVGSDTWVEHQDGRLCRDEGMSLGLDEL